MIRLPSQAEMKKLTTHKGPNCISIYMEHTESPGTAANPDRIALKNLRRQAKILLDARGVQPRMVKKLLKPVDRLLDDQNFWLGLNDSLGIFISREHSFIYRLPGGHIPERAFVNDHFDYQPLERLVQQNSHYYLLSLGHKNVNVYKGDRYHLEPVTPDSLPTDMHETLRIDEYLTSLETHNVAPAGNGSRSESYHGQYNVKEEDKKDLLKFFRQIDKRLRGFLQKKGSPPLIVAGVAYLAPIYRQANTYRNLVPRAINRNIEHADTQEVLVQASQLAKSSN